MVRLVSAHGGGEETGGKRRPRGAHDIRTQACTLLLAGTMATLAPAAKIAAPGIATLEGRPGTAISRVDGGLSGVAFTSARNGWAVGATDFSLATMIEHWNGTAWKLVPSPNGTARQRGPSLSRKIMPVAWLSGVAATSAANAWAVGGHWVGDAAQSLILHWDGSKWQPVPSPSPGGSSGNTYVSAVAATSPANAWAVGEYYTGTTNRALILHWNGRRWRQVHSPNPGPSAGLSAVAATSATSAWSVGSLIEHWNGTAWRRVPSPVRAMRLLGVTAPSARNAWAVGQTTAGTPLILHWNGTAWRRVPSPVRASDSTLVSVAALSPRDAWAVGSGPSGAIVMHWNGTTWKVTPAPGMVGGDGLADVTALSATNAWAVGGIGAAGHRPLIEHWNGTIWQQVPNP